MADGKRKWSDDDRDAALARYYVLDTPAEPEFDDLVRLVSATFAAPIAAINLIASGRQWFKAEVGTIAREFPLDMSICAHALDDPECSLLVVPDLRDDPRFADNPLVRATDGLRFYAGAMLRNAAGLAIGTLCVLDRVPRPDGITPHQRDLLEVLARQVMSQLELRRALANQVEQAGEFAAMLAERRQSQVILKAIEERYRLTALATNDAIWDWDFTTNHVAWNAALSASYGHQPADVEPTGEWWLGRIHPDDRTRVTTSIHAAIDGNADSWSDEYRFARADGTYAEVLDRGHIIRDEGGRATRMIGAMLDISERQKNRAALALNEERLRLATEAAEVGFWDFKPTDGGLAWPPIVKRMFGISADKPISMQDFYDGLHPDDRDATTLAFAAACDPIQQALYDVEYRTIGKEDGLLRWVAAKGRGIFTEDGRCLRVLGTAIDVTARKLANQAVRESERRLRFLRGMDEALGGAADAPEAMRAAAELLARRLDASRCAYADVDADCDRFVIRADWVADDVASSVGVYSLDLFGSRAVADMHGGHTLVVHDVSQELAVDDGREMFQSIGIDAIICCPLVKDGRLVAMMAVHQTRPRVWTAEEISLVEAAVERCWAHVQRIGAEARLRDSEERYRTLFAAVDAGFTIAEVKFDADDRPIDYRLLEMNPAFALQTGMDNLLGRWVREAIPTLEQHWFDIYGRVALTGEAAQFENRAEAMGRWFDVQAFRIGAPEDRLVAILFNDITERKQSEKLLRDLNEDLEAQVAARTAELRFSRDIIEATTSPICAFDRDLRVLAFNKAHHDEFRRVNGFDVAPGDILPDLFPPDQGTKLRALMQRALGGERFTARESFGRPELAQPCWEISLTPMRNEDAEIVGAFYLANDISDRLRAEKELAAAQEALRQSQKMEAMGSLTGGVAHDFNNLLTPIIGGLDLLQRKGVGGEREQRLIGGALHSAERAKTLVQRLLAFARRQPLQARAVDLAALVTGMADLVASTSGPQTRLILDVGDDLPAALADPNQLEMAILNLSVNARDAMPDGGRLSISARQVELGRDNTPGLAPGRYVRLSVADTGIGMDAETLRRAAEPFYSTKGIGQGTGLGLSMVHGLAAQLGGALTIDSRPGLGTDVQLWLPVTDAAAETTEHTEESVASVTVGLALVVDDEAVVRASTADMLADLGYDITEADSAEQALQLIADGLMPDLLVTDHLMPGKTGTDLAREVLARLPGTRVLIVSGYAEADGIAPDLPRLVKPFRQADLVASIADPT
ncbi:PAS domain-containing protein [Croceibacterium sp. TMG7-5b_MA50]|uniref:PAS domain-containing protein n=1 Tax=Croceibacterium sp. TMG7-5b_MA50 TaxID=3121290 RepID=UPI003221BF45